MRRGKKKNNNTNKIVNIVIIVIIIALVGALAVMVSGNTKNNGNTGIKAVTYEEYEELIKRDEYTILLLTQPTCGHCQNYKPFVKYAASEYGLMVYDINVSGNLSSEQFANLHSYSALADQYNEAGQPIIPTPATIIIKNGKEIASRLGNIEYDGFVSMLKENGVITK